MDKWLAAASASHFFVESKKKTQKEIRTKAN